MTARRVAAWLVLGAFAAIGNLCNEIGAGFCAAADEVGAALDQQRKAAKRERRHRQAMERTLVEIETLPITSSASGTWEPK